MLIKSITIALYIKKKMLKNKKVYNLQNKNCKSKQIKEYQIFVNNKINY